MSISIVESQQKIVWSDGVSIHTMPASDIREYRWWVLEGWGTTPATDDAMPPCVVESPDVLKYIDDYRWAEGPAVVKGIGCHSLLKANDVCERLGLLAETLAEEITRMSCDYPHPIKPVGREKGFSSPLRKFLKRQIGGTG